jgi:hypothetical protein
MHANRRRIRKDACGILIGKRLLQDRKREGRQCHDYPQEDGQTGCKYSPKT